VQRLLGIEPINVTRCAWIVSLFLTFWTTLAPHVLFLQIIIFVNPFQSSFANSQR
jgi:hypothetical protein